MNFGRTQFQLLLWNLLLLLHFLVLSLVLQLGEQLVIDVELVHVVQVVDSQVLFVHFHLLFGILTALELVQILAYFFNARLFILRVLI